MERFFRWPIWYEISDDDFMEHPYGYGLKRKIVDPEPPTSNVMEWNLFSPLKLMNFSFNEERVIQDSKIKNKNHPKVACIEEANSKVIFHYYPRRKILLLIQRTHHTLLLPNGKIGRAHV